ncbi:DUF7527 domain-containing protein [Halorarius litoreus]|uniref:DUF7527 domain-containing protein n=1 Tax=Halorarius litoreus TaxID=2962676 RepID=UPI0020CDB304|nr:hypothetical protein [Halorarius litoreus]
METWVDEIEGWDDRPFSGGYDGLHDLAATDFSGAVSAGGTWLFMVNGRVVAVVQYRQTRAGSEVVDADIDRFEDASGTAYAAPDPSIPLLVAMKTRDGDSRGRYYSVKTPIDEVAATLEDGGFTGYIELSENVLSGDYYSVYQAGRSMDLAFIGNARRLKTGEDAHERMVDEVGIYEVIAVDLDVVDIPGDSTGAEAAGAGAGAGAGAAGAAGAGAMDAESTVESNGGTDTAPADPTESEPVTDPAAEPTEPEAAIETVEEHDDPATDNADEETETAQPGEAATEPDDATEPGEPTQPEPEADDPDPVTDPTPPADESAMSATDQLATRSVPSLDPANSSSGEPAATPSTSSQPEPAPATPSTEPQSTTQHADPDELADLREELREARAELASTREERDELAATVEQLRARIRELEASAGGGGGPSLTPTEAFAGTNLFVRYGSKGALTVEDVHDGDGDLDALLSNLQLTHHTQFDAAAATVDGRPFDDWLSSTQRYRFARWLVTALVLEIRETGAVDGMRDLYDALPELDRVEFDGSVTATDEEGERSVEFDIVCRNRMGEPLAVARLESSREPVSETTMGAFVTDATDVVQRHESLVGACYVTSAFFAPEALETAREATSGSLLSRDRRKSYVKISRNRGYHLALVESREENFHLSVPDL